MRTAQNTAFRGWVAGSNARSRAFSGWVILTQAQGETRWLEGTVSLMTSSAAEMLTLDNALWGSSDQILEPVAALTLDMQLPAAYLDLHPEATAQLWLEQILSGESLLWLDATGLLRTFSRVFTKEILAEKAIVFVDGEQTPDGQLVGAVSVVGTVQALVQLLQLILANLDPDDALGGAVAVKEYVPAQRAPIRSTGGLKRTTKIRASKA